MVVPLSKRRSEWIDVDEQLTFTLITDMTRVCVVDRRRVQGFEDFFWTCGTSININLLSPRLQVAPVRFDRCAALRPALPGLVGHRTVSNGLFHADLSL